MNSTSNMKRARSALGSGSSALKNGIFETNDVFLRPKIGASGRVAKMRFPYFKGLNESTKNGSLSKCKVERETNVQRRPMFSGESIQAPFT